MIQALARQSFTEEIIAIKKTFEVINITTGKNTSETGETQPKITKNGLKIILVMQIINYVEKMLGPDSYPWEKGRRKVEK